MDLCVFTMFFYPCLSGCVFYISPSVRYNHCAQCLAAPMLKQLLCKVYVLLAGTWLSAHCARDSRLFFTDRLQVTSAASRPGPSPARYKASIMCTNGEQGDVVEAILPD